MPTSQSTQLDGRRQAQLEARLRFTFHDPKTKQIVTLGGTSCPAEHREQVWTSVSRFDGQTYFDAELLDITHNPVAAKPVSAEVVEVHLGQAIAELIDAGRRDLNIIKNGRHT